MVNQSTARHIPYSFLVSLILITACSKKEISNQNEEISSKASVNAFEKAAPKGTAFYALTSDGKLVKYSSGNPLYELSDVLITGLQNMEKIIAIDFRPATGQLYGVSDQSRLYMINQNTGVAVAVSLTPFTPAINGAQVGFDFNPTVDRIRLVTNNDQNLRLNPETGMVAATDGMINPADATVTAVAYTNSFAGATTTILYDIDVAGNKLFKQNPPNNGTLELVGSLGVQAVGEAGFDIAPDNSVCIASIYGRGLEDGDQAEESNGNKYRFYYINLMTGEAINAGKTDREITGIAIPTDPVAYAISSSNNLLIFNPWNAGSQVTKSITGLQAGENLLGIDMRPASAQLYALGSTGRIYAINMSSGAASVIGVGPFAILNGTSFGFDFNPTVDRIRLVSNTGQNLRIHPTLGTVAVTDPSLNPGTPNVDAAAYTNSFAGSVSTTLYDIDFTTDALFIQNPANAGTLINVGSLGVNIHAGNGFDIGGMSNNGWGIFTVGNTAGLYSINLMTGAATMISAFPSDVKGFAVGLGF